MFYVLSALAILSATYTIGYARHVWRKKGRKAGAVIALGLHIIAAILPLVVMQWK